MSGATDGRKRKFGTVTKPCDDEINSSIGSSCSSQKSLRLEFDDYTSSEGEDGGGSKQSIKVVLVHVFITFVWQPSSI